MKTNSYVEAVKMAVADYEASVKGYENEESILAVCSWRVDRWESKLIHRPNNSLHREI